MLRQWVKLVVLAIVAATTPAGTAATPGLVNILAVGDSMSEEYAFETIFSAPVSDQTRANVHNWPELLRFWRPTEATLGRYESSALAYPDLRDGGHEWNFGIPGATTSQWVDILNATSVFSPYYTTRNALLEKLYYAHVVVIFLGGNDLKAAYYQLYAGTDPPSLLNGIISNLTYIHDYIRIRQPSLPIIICTIPNVGASPAVLANYNIPANIAMARSKIDALNSSITSLAAVKGATLVQIHQLTDRIFDDHPFHLNGTIFQTTPNDGNPPDRIFCRDGFHPSTVAQALIANLILDGITRATGRTLTQFSNREILQTVLGMNPDQPYLNWAVGYAGTGGMSADSDGDGIPNLAEYVLGTSPRAAGSPFSFSSGPPGTLRFLPSATALRFASLTVWESSNLTAWSAVPSNRISISGDGTWTIAPNGQPRGFYRVRAETRP